MANNKTTVTADPLGDEIRKMLPISQYVRMLHIAATTGVMPVCTAEGEVLDHGSEIDGKQRQDIARYLVDKVVAGAKAEQAKPDIDLDALTSNLASIATLSTRDIVEQLSALKRSASNEGAAASAK